jgi:Ca2+-dependent lipid-binding protein
MLVIHTANCGTPIPPQDGDLDPFSSTLESAEVNITCSSGVQNKISCDHDGRWQPNPNDICSSTSGINFVSHIYHVCIILYRIVCDSMNSITVGIPESIATSVILGVIFGVIIIVVPIITTLIMYRCIYKRFYRSLRARKSFQYQHFDKEDTIESDTNT